MPTIVNQRFRDALRTVLPGETPLATAMIELHNFYGLCADKTSHELISGSIGNTTAVEALAGQPGVRFEVRSLFLNIYAGLTACTDPTTLTIMDGNLTAATGVLTFTGIAVEDTTITIGNRTYTWKAAPGATDEITVGANQAASEANLTTAINSGPQGGGAAHTQVTAVDGAGTVTLTAVTAGSAGNAIATTETMASASFGGATLSGGNDGNELSRLSITGDLCLAKRYYEGTIFFDPVLRTTAGNGIYLDLDNNPGAGGFVRVFGTGWIIA